MSTTRNLVHRSSRQLQCVWSLAFAILLMPGVVAQESTDSSDLSAARQKYNEASDRLRTAVGETNRFFQLYYHSPADESDKWRDEWQKAGEAGLSAEKDLKDAAVEILMNSNEPGEEVMGVGVRTCRDLYQAARYEKAYQIADRLVELNDKVEYRFERAKSALFTNRFDVVKSFSSSFGDRLVGMPELETGLLGELDRLQQNFVVESEVRRQEEESDDLPRVELETTKGKIVIELFENEAPETVGNFINLVEQGFYDGIVFHQVEKNFLAQAGGYTIQGPRKVNYTIYDEFKKKGARNHFRGSVSMASRPPAPNTGSSEFFILTIPFPDLDGHHTVFGRVISDMDVVDLLEATITRDGKGEAKQIEDGEFDHIIKAKVLRKRDHEYKTVPVTEETD